MRTEVFKTEAAEPKWRCHKPKLISATPLFDALLLFFGAEIAAETGCTPRWKTSPRCDK